jgi:hypothetical protein
VATGTDAYVLLAGNNLPKDFKAASTYPSNTFMGQFQSFGADVTALGQDDLLRAVFPAKLPGLDKPPSRFTPPVQAFFKRNDFRFLASNAAIRTNKAGLNKTWYKGYELLISADQSIPWTTLKLKFNVPDGPNHTARAGRGYARSWHRARDATTQHSVFHDDRRWSC